MAGMPGICSITESRDATSRAPSSLPRLLPERSPPCTRGRPTNELEPSTRLAWDTDAAETAALSLFSLSPFLSSLPRKEKHRRIPTGIKSRIFNVKLPGRFYPVRAFDPTSCAALPSRRIALSPLVYACASSRIYTPPSPGTYRYLLSLSGRLKKRVRFVALKRAQVSNVTCPTRQILSHP